MRSAGVGRALLGGGPASHGERVRGRAHDLPELGTHMWLVVVARVGGQLGQLLSDTGEHQTNTVDAHEPARRQAHTVDKDGAKVPFADVQVSSDTTDGLTWRAADGTQHGRGLRGDAP